MEIKKLSKEWLEGFAKEAMDMGLSSDQAAELLKVAATQEVAQDPNFKAGYSEVMQKTAGPIGKLLGELGSHLFSAVKAHPFQALGIGALGKWGWDNYVDPYINQTPEQRRMKEGLMNRKGDDFTRALQQQANQREQDQANTYNANRNRAKSLYNKGDAFADNGWWSS